MKIRSIGLRLSLIYTAAFALAVLLLGAVMLLAARGALKAQFERAISAESAALTQEFVSEGLDGVVQAVQERDSTLGALDYGLEDPQRRPVAGRLTAARPPLGWSQQNAPSRNGGVETVRVLTVALPDGYRLMVGDDLERIDALDDILLRGFAFTLLGVIVLGGAGGYLFSEGVRRRFAAISDVADAISEGDLGQRVAVRRAKDDLDHLGLTFNRMLDRIGGLMDSLRQVSSDVAHDLRTPLTRLRQRLEGALASADPAARSQAIEEAMVDLDAILETFAALLRIAQIEGGARRAGFREVNLARLAREVVESFAPSAEDGGRTLVFETPGDILVEGDAELLTQMIVNLVENSLHHTPVGSRVSLGVLAVGRDVVLRVADNGPGVPADEQAQVLQRFYRLEPSRSTPGSGLGLALVAAVAKLHEAQVALSDADPGLEVQVRFVARA